MTHDDIDRRGLLLDQAVVERLREDPSLWSKPKENLRRWLDRNRDSPSLCRCYREWLHILETRSRAEVEALMLGMDEEARRLRQNSPFTGILSPAEVWEIKKRFRDETLS